MEGDFLKGQERKTERKVGKVGKVGLVTRILVVEDESAIREMVSFTLSRTGFELLEAADGMQAREHLAAGDIDLVLLDWMLPGESGLDLLAMIKADPATVLARRADRTDSRRAAPRRRGAARGGGGARCRDVDARPGQPPRLDRR